MSQSHQVFDLNEFSGPFRAETDRACAVLGAALLDEKLKNLFERRLQYAKKKLLDHSGILGSFASRITVARSLMWIAEDVRFDLDQIRDIRNKFAHNADHKLSFSNQSIAAKCGTLRVAQTLLEAQEALASRPPDHFSPEAILAMASVIRPPRQRYEITIEMLAQHLDALEATHPAYTGPDLRQELWNLGSKEATVTVLVTNSPGRI